MNISSFYPLVYVDDLEAALDKYEDMGFSMLHTLECDDFKLHVMKLSDYRLDIFRSDREELQMKEGYFAIRINVDDLQDGLDMCESLGYEMVAGPLQEPSFQLVVLDNKLGNRILLFHHIQTSFSFSD